jgi:peptidyl-prolyl cis-trans isomerase SurA
LFAAVLGLQAQNKNNVLVTIGNDTITVDEFAKAYGKNNNLATATEKDLREYLDLFINFKMKVKEGELLQLDTSRQFKMELKQYQNQSAQQFLVDKEVTKELEDEVLTRAMSDIRASHILVNCSEMAKPQDTLAAYNKIMSIRNEIMSGSISFADAAVKYSDDPSARDMVNPQTQRLHPGNKGDLGYFTVFDLIYPFESVAYNTPVGQVSQPVRTQFGYHLIYVLDRIDAIQEITIEQVYISDSLAKNGNKLPTTTYKLAAAQQALQSGTSFGDVARQYSEDSDVAVTGGRQEPFAPNRRQGDFVKAILSLKTGEVSQPIASQNGWHLIRVVDIKPFVLDDDSRYSLVNRISRDSRSFKSKDAFIAKLKKEYNYKEPGRAKAMKTFLKNMPAEFFQSKESDLTSTKGIEKLPPMATFADEEVTAEEFAKFINRFRGMRLSKEEFSPFLEERFDLFVKDKITRYENAHLLEKYSDLRDLVQEFHDGMVLYEINTTKVWAAAVQDSVGLEKFYVENSNRYLDPTTQQPKPLTEIRAIVITDFQEYLDKQWILELREKYQPAINEKALSTLIKK